MEMRTSIAVLRKTLPENRQLGSFPFRGFCELVSLSGFRVLSLMKRQAGKTESFAAQFAAFDMGSAERCTAVAA
jgi:hypothetical protein